MCLGCWEDGWDETVLCLLPRAPRTVYNILNHIYHKNIYFLNLYIFAIADYTESNLLSYHN